MKRLSNRTSVCACIVAVAAGAAASCANAAPVLTQYMEARRLASALHVQFIKAADAANRAVGADTDQGAATAAREARQATEAVQRDVEQLQPILQSLAYADAMRQLEAFKSLLAESQRLDDEILPLAVENTNLKAQRLSFGPAQEAADAFDKALEAVARSDSSKGRCCVQAIVGTARAAVLGIQVIEARHIPEADEAAMSRMEAQMAASELSARESLDALRGLAPSTAEAALAAAAAALDRFTAINSDIVRLSRRNSNVRSLALSLGRKRTVTAAGDDALGALEAALAQHEFKATR